MNHVLEVLNNRTSLRKYHERPIKNEELDAIIHAALRAPTAGNMMPYSIVIIKDEEMKEILSHTCDEQPFIAKAPVVLVFIADFQKWQDYYRVYDVEAFCKENDILFEAPSEGNLFLAIEDALIACQNAVIAAESLGIGSCYIGDIMEHFEKHQELLNLPQYAFPVAMLTLGYYEEHHHKVLRERFDKKYVVFNEKYQKLNDDEIKNMFAHLDKRFSSANKYEAKNYAQLHYVSKTHSDFSKEMARSVKEVLKIWNGKKLNK